MAEIAVSSTLNKLVALKTEEVKNLSPDVQRYFAELAVELKAIWSLVKDADRRAAYEDETKTWVTQVTEACFRLEDVVDELQFYLEQLPHRPSWLRYLKSWKSRRRIASEVAEIKWTLNLIKTRSEKYGFQSSKEQGSSSSSYREKDQDPPVEEYDRRLASLEEDEVVGFDAPKRQLIDWLLRGEETGRTVISIVGMGGLGKTTLAKKVFDNPEITNHFDCRAWITVSQSYTIERVLREMMRQFWEAKREPLPEDLFKMDKTTLVTKVRNYLEKNRYEVFFDDVWTVGFWGEIEHAMPDNEKSGRIVITTRNKGVADFCMKSSLCHMYEQSPLTSNDAWKLFCKKAFRFESDGHCPPDLEGISREIVHRCEGLPLAIVAIGGLLSTKKKVGYEWKKLYQNLSSELEENPPLTGLTRVLTLSYDDLPYCLKSCFLYIGIYPEHYTIRCARLIRQWIAEGFVEHLEGKTLEEVAEGYLAELVNRSLVQVSCIQLEGRPKSCQIHDMLREMAIRKMNDLGVHFVFEDNPLMSNQITRRLVIAGSSYALPVSVRTPRVRSIHIFNEGKLPESVLSTLTRKYGPLKVLDFENALLSEVPDKLGNLFHLRYLSLRNTNVQVLPKSIGKMLNLETLDLRQTLVHEIPSDIKRLTKLRLLLVYHQNYNTKSSLNGESGFKIKEGIACLTSLQKLYYVQANHGGIHLIKQLSKLKELRKLGLKHVRREYGKNLCASIKEMIYLESLDITAIARDEIIDLHSISSPPKLQRLCLCGQLERLPDWIPKLEFLIRLKLAFSKLNDDALKSLNNLPNLLDLSICNNAYVGEVLHFEEGYFHKLKNLFLERLDKLNSILIERGALPVLEQFEIWSLPKLKVVPHGIHYLYNLQVLDFADLLHEFIQSIDPDYGSSYWIIKHVPVVYIHYKVGPRDGIVAFDTRTIKHSKPM